jgi:hypothetical protein
MKRYALLGLLVASALSFAIIIFLWIRSGWYSQDDVHYGFADQAEIIEIRSQRSMVVCRWALSKDDQHQFSSLAMGIPNGWLWQTSPCATAPLFPGFHMDNWHHHANADARHGNIDEHDLEFEFPDWMLAILFFAGFAPWLILRSRKKRSRGDGLCASCGYDLRANKERCPECGAPVPTS